MAPRQRRSPPAPLESTDASSSSSTTTTTNGAANATKIASATAPVILASDDNNNNNNVVVLTSAPPPWHAVFFLSLTTVAFVAHLPSWHDLDSDLAVPETFTHALFLDDKTATRQLALIRACFAAVIWATTLYVSVLTDGWEQKTSYKPQSKLKMVPNHLKGWKTLFPFTSWSWNLLGVSFTLSSYIAYQTAAGRDVSQPVLRAAAVAWEIAAPCTLLVASCIRYVIWPSVLQNPQGNTQELKSMRNFMMHNINVMFALTESCLLGGLPVRGHHAVLSSLWGCLYVIFSWNMTMRWNDAKQHGPQFIYFFFDTTLPGYTCTLALFALLTVLFLFHGLFCTANRFLFEYLGGGFVTHALFVIGLSSLLMRFRD